MPIHCPQCGKEYDVIEFEGEKPIQCRCGHRLDISLLETADDITRYCQNEEERKKAQEIQKDAAGICRMILFEKADAIDIEIAKSRLEEKVRELFPDKVDLYRMIYEARFIRLWEQFRVGGQESN